MDAVVIAIGDELLLGKTVNNNAAFLSRRLAALGVPTRRQLVVGDARDDIVAAVREGRELATLIVATGGLGPTDDDRTLAAVAGYLGLELVLHAPTLKHIEQLFERRRIPMPPLNVGQARVPAGARVLRNPLGTAPGLVVEGDGFVLCLLPGVPAEMEYLFENGLAPYLEQKGYLGERVFEWQIRTVGLPESAVAEKVGKLPVPGGLRLAYLPHHAQVDLRMWGAAPDEAAFRERAGPLAKGIHKALGADVFAEGDATLEEVVGRLLTRRGATLAVAESCTGGLIAKRLTDVAGASAWFRGGVVSYANDAKVDLLGVEAATLAAFGAVSEETTREMAAGARCRLGADYALAATGVAGPTGGTDAKPVGTVCLALAAEDGVASETAFFTGDREWIRWRAATRALDLLRRRLLAKGGKG